MAGKLKESKEKLTAKTNKAEMKPEEVGIVDVGMVGEENVLFSWRAAVRPFKKRDRDYYTTIASIAFLIVVILIFLKEYFLIAVVIAFAFVAYVLATIPPEETEHRLTNRGIRTADKLYRWGDLRRYWFSEKFGQRMIHIQTYMLFPGQLLLMLGKGNEKRIREIVNERLPYDEPEPTFMDKSANWLSEKVPLEKQQSSS